MECYLQYIIQYQKAEIYSSLEKAIEEAKKCLQVDMQYRETKGLNKKYYSLVIGIGGGGTGATPIISNIANLDNESLEKIILDKGSYNTFIGQKK